MATAVDRDMRGISTCWQYGPRGWHAYGAGPCFDDYETAIRYRDWLDREGIGWASEDDRRFRGWYYYRGEATDARQ